MNDVVGELSTVAIAARGVASASRSDIIAPVLAAEVSDGRAQDATSSFSDRISLSSDEEPLFCLKSGDVEGVGGGIAGLAAASAALTEAVGSGWELFADEEPFAQAPALPSGSAAGGLEEVTATAASPPLDAASPTTADTVLDIWPRYVWRASLATRAALFCRHKNHPIAIRRKIRPV